MLPFQIKEKQYKAEKSFYEKEISICKVIQDYYNRTYKNISRYMPKLSILASRHIDEISVIGHSLAGVDIPYFESIDNLTGRLATWKIYYRRNEEKKRMTDSLIKCGVDVKRIEMLNSKEFFDL